MEFEKWQSVLKNNNKGSTIKISGKVYKVISLKENISTLDIDDCWRILFVLKDNKNKNHSLEIIWGEENDITFDGMYLDGEAIDEDKISLNQD